MGDTGFALLVALLAALAALFFVLLGAVIVRHYFWRRGDAVSPNNTRRGFVLFDVCLEEAGAAADDQVEPGAFEIARWKMIFGGPNRSLSTIDEGTEKGGTTPAFSTPPASPDRRDAGRALDMETIAVQLRQA